jgi:hypothetical protein
MQMLCRAFTVVLADQIALFELAREPDDIGEMPVAPSASTAFLHG